MQKGWLPIHGAFVNITLKNGKSGICLHGDSGAGKSETIEALKSLGNEKIKKHRNCLTTWETFHVEDGTVYAKGTK